MPAKSSNIHQRMLKVMDSVKYIQKEDKKVNNQYRFVSHDAVAKKLRQPMIDAGILAIPTVRSHAFEGKNMTIIELVVTFANAENPDDKIETTSIGYGVDNQDKGPGKAYSYAYKYALLKAFNLETGDDPEADSIDADLTEPEPETTPDPIALAITAMQQKYGIELPLLVKHLDVPTHWGGKELGILRATYADIGRGRDFEEAITSHIKANEPEEEDD